MVDRGDYFKLRADEPLNGAAVPRVYEKRPGVWHADLRLNGRRQRPCLAAKTRAEAEREALLRFLNAGGVPQQRSATGAAVSRGITVLQALDDYVANLKRNGKRARTISSAKTARNAWAPYVEKTPAAELTPEAVDAFIDARRAAGIRPATINASLTALRAALNLAVERKRLERLPFRIRLRTDPAAKRIPDALKPEEVRQLLEAAPDDLLRALLTVAVSTGARRGELLALRWRDVRGNCLTFQADTTKTGEGRRVFLNARAVEELERYRAGLAHAGPDDPVFQRCTRTGSAAATDVEWISRRVREAFEAAGLDKKSRPDLRPGLHLLRRTAATIMIQSGEDALTVQRVCGWKSPAMLQRYVGTDDNARRGAAERLGSALW